jgi:unsaturated rhamnogalacturonyl hydrolase
MEASGLKRRPYQSEDTDGKRGDCQIFCEDNCAITHSFAEKLMNGALATLLFVLAFATSVSPGSLEKQFPSAKTEGSKPYYPSTPISADGDLSKEIVDTTIKRLPSAGSLGGWEYTRALFLLGELSVYQRTHDPRYLAYARAWADSHISPQGSVDHSIDALDFIMPGDVAVALYRETQDPRYKLATDRLAAILRSYPRTSDGAFWHSMDSGREHQIWLDGSFMVVPFLVEQGALSGHRDAADAEAARQILLYGAHMRDSKGQLYFHAYDESGKAPWSDSIAHHSPEKWGRAIGWYSMALINVLNAMPKRPATAAQRKKRRQLIAITRDLARDLMRFQDPTTGLWFQIVDKPNLAGNFPETSCSSMFTYFLHLAVRHGYIEAGYGAAAQRGYHGVLSMVFRGAEGGLHIRGICEGTVVGDQSYYLRRKTSVDDFHGLGAFLLMNEEVRFNRSILDELASKSYFRTARSTP